MGRAVVLLDLVLYISCVDAGTDGATPLFFHEQMEPGNLDQLQSGLPIGLDAAGKLVPRPRWPA